MKAMKSLCTVKNKKYLFQTEITSYRKTLLIFLIIPVIAFIISNYVYQVTLIQGDSMLPSYHNMQFVILNRYDKNYTYGDVVAFRNDNLDTVLVKRIAACPHDEAVIRDGTLYVNGAVSTVYPTENSFEYAGMLDSTVVLSDSEYIVIGDNLVHSKDSRDREIGIITADSIIGKIQ